MAGRPTIYTEELGLEICARIACGETVRSIGSDPAMPEDRTIFRWAVDESHPFCQQYALARKVQAEGFVDEIKEIVDNGSNDWMVKYEKETGESVYVVNGEAIQRSRLRFQARQWLASKFLPKVYGEKQTVDLNAQVQSTVVVNMAEVPSETIDKILEGE